MKGSLLLGVLLTSAMSANVFAIEVHDGKLISHKEWSQGKLTGSFKEVVKTKNAKKEWFKSQSKKAFTLPAGDFAWTDVHNDAFNAQGVVGKELTLSGSNYLSITNGTSSNQTYKITTIFSICYFGSSSTCYIESVSSEDIVTLDPKGWLLTNRNPEVVKSFDEGGDGVTMMDTYVEVEGSKGNPHLFSSSSDFGFIEIYDAVKNNK